MAANTLLITEASREARYLLHGDMDVAFDTAVSAGFSVNFFTVNSEEFVLKSSHFQFRDLSGTFSNELVFGGKAGLFIELRFDIATGIWYVTANNVVSNEMPIASEYRIAELTATDVFPELAGDEYDAFYIMLSNDGSLAVPLIKNPRLGYTYKIFLQQDPVGNRLLTFNSKFKFSVGRTPVLSTNPGQIDFISVTPLPGGVSLCVVDYSYATASIARIGNNVYDTMAAAAAEVNDGEVIVITRSGNMAETLASFIKSAPPIAIGIAGLPGLMPTLTVDGTIRLSFGKAVLNPEYGELYLRDFQINGAAVPESGNGAAVRINPRTRYAQFDNIRLSKNENGILCAPLDEDLVPARDVYSLVIQDCVLDNNGYSNESHRGLTHNVYLQHAQRVYALRSQFTNSAFGHDFKNRSDQLLIDRCIFSGSNNARALDTPNGGIVHAVNCYFRKPTHATQSNLVGIGQEGVIAREQQYIFRNCLFENLRNTNYQLTFVNQQNSNVTVYFVDCVFLGSPLDVFNVGPVEYIFTGGHLGPEDYDGPSGFIPQVGTLPDGSNAFTPVPNQPVPIYGPDPTLEWFPPTGSTPTNTYAPNPQIVGVNTTALSQYPTIDNTPPVPDTTSPTITLAASSIADVTQETNRTLVASVTDNVRVTKVEFYKDGVLIDTDATAPYSSIVALTAENNGSVVFTAKAFDAAGNNTTSNSITINVNIVVLPEPTVYPFSVSPDLLTAYNTAIDTAPAGTKRIAGAQAIVNAMKPDYRLYIYQEDTLIVPIEYIGDLKIVNDGTNIAIELGVPDTSDPVKSAKITEGTWHFELEGGTDYANVIKGSTGPMGSGKILTLSADPEPGVGNTFTFKLVIPRSIDGLS